jgi:uncharacterized protein
MSLLGTASMKEDTPSSDRFRLKPGPLMAGIFFSLALPFLSFLTVEFFKLVGLPERPQMPWLAEYYFHIILFCYAYLAILLMKRAWPGDYGFQWPRARSYVWTALILGIALGALTMLFDHWSELVDGRQLYQYYSRIYARTPVNIAGWAAFDGVVIGVAQETMFRGFLVGFLTHAMPGRIRIGSFSMNGAGIVAAPIYALFLLLYSARFLSEPLTVLLGQFGCACLLGIFLAYWFEKSRSLLAPIIGHNAAALTEQALVFAMVGHWR